MSPRSGLLAAIAAALLLPAAAGAATVQLAGGIVYVSDDTPSGEVNAITVSATGTVVQVDDTGVAPTPGTGCAPSAGGVSCSGATSVVVTAGQRNDTVTVSSSTTMVTTLNGGEGDDVLQGGGGNDSLDGQNGSDRLLGGPGADDFSDSGSGASDVDKVSYADHGSTGVTASLDNARNDGAASVEGSTLDIIRNGIERLDGGAGADTLTGSAGPDILVGGNGDDTLTGGAGADRFEGDLGADLINADDGAADVEIDCDNAVQTAPGDIANLDVADPDPLRCETVNRAVDHGGAPNPSPNPNPSSEPGPSQPSGPSQAPSKPTNTGLPTIGAASGADAPYRLGTELTCMPGRWMPTNVTVAGYRWYRYAFGTDGPVASAPQEVARTQAYTVGKEDRGNLLACLEIVANSAGANGALSPRVGTRKRIRIPARIRRMGLEQAKAYLRRLFDGSVSITADGAARTAIPCDFGGDQPDKDGCNATPPIRPGQVFNSTPAIGRSLDEAYGSGKLPRIVLDVYDPAKDRDNHVPAPTAKEVCPVRDGQAVRDDFEARVLGKYVQYARDLLTKYHCPFSETARFNVDQTTDPYVTGLDVASFGGERGYRLTVSKPKIPDLAAAIFHRRLAGRDVYQGANLSRGPLNPGLGTDGRLTAIRAAQKNDVCLHVILTATGQAVPGANIRLYGPDGREATNAQGQTTRRVTNQDGDACASFDVHETGAYRFEYTYYGSNGATAEGGVTVAAIDRGKSRWTTISGREMQCDAAECAQLGFQRSRRARAAAFDIGAFFQSIMRSLFGGRSPVVNPTGAQAAAADDGGASPTLVSAQAQNGSTPGLLLLRGRAGLIGQDGASLIGQDGASLIGQDGASVRAVTQSLITQDGGSLVAVNAAQANGTTTSAAGTTFLAVREGRIIGNDGASLIGQDGASLIGQDGASLIGQDGASLKAPPGGAVVAFGDRTVIAGANGVVPKGTLISQDGASAIPVTGRG